LLLCEGLAERKSWQSREYEQECNIVYFIGNSMCLSEFGESVAFGNCLEALVYYTGCPREKFEYEYTRCLKNDETTQYQTIQDTPRIQEKCLKKIVN
jgi:hypothetical protein